MTELDKVVGDGDLGINLEIAAKDLEKLLNDFGLPLKDLPETFQVIGNRLQETLGGSSGPLYSVFFLRFARRLREDENWVESFLKGVEGMEELGGAKEGDATMIDALRPAVRALEGLSSQDPKEIASTAAKGAEEGAQGTVPMMAQKGRASYLSQRSQGHIDPGAKAVAIILRAISDAL